jgi:hypothetical protein
VGGAAAAAISNRELRLWTRRVGRLADAGKVEAARTRATKLAERHPGSASARVAIAELHLRLGDPERAAAAFLEAWEVGPMSRRWKIAEQVAHGLSAAGRDEEAYALLAADPPAMAAGLLAVERATLLRRLGRPEEAVADLESALEEHPQWRPAWDLLIELLDELDRGAAAEEARRRRDAVPPKLTTTAVVEAVAGADPGSTRYVVNVGCRDGRNKDPCYELYHRGFPGLAIDAGDYPRLHRNLPQPEVNKVLNTTLTPANVVEVLRREGCPERPALLKIDIDGYDGVLLEAALAGFEPEVIQMEVNADFPPPLRFAVQYDPRLVPSGTAGFYGCSLSHVLSVVRPLGYELLQVDFSDPQVSDALFVKERHLGLWGIEPPVDERELFLREPYGGWRGLVAVGADTRPWRTATDPHAVLPEAWDACVAASLYRDDVVLPFLLAV